MVADIVSLRQLSGEFYSSKYRMHSETFINP